MSIFRRDAGIPTSLIPSRTPARRNAPVVTTTTAMQQSVIWASISLHAGLESMMPLDVFRLIDGVKANVPPPQVLATPSSFADGHPDSIADWLYARRAALKQSGNCFGEITAVDGAGKPAQIQLIPTDDVRIRIKNYRIVEYRFGRTVMEARKVWHSRDNLLAGVPVGLSPIAHAMLTLQTSVSATEFMADWFAGGATPGAHLKNTNKVLKKGESAAVKARFRQSVGNGDVFVTGSDWEYKPISAKAAESGWLEAINASAVDLCRFMDTPANMIDVAANGSARITYQNLTQANLDFMVTRMGPALKRTDDELTAITPSPRFVRLNRNALLAMDPTTAAELLKVQIESRTRTPNEARQIDDRPPLTEADYAEFDRLFGSKNQNPTPKGLPA